MATVLGDVQWDALLKELYPSGVPEDMLQRDHTFLSMVTKDSDAYGEYMVIPVIYSGPSGRSADIATLLSSTGPHRRDEVGEVHAVRGRGLRRDVD
jgi:hypothetical protein